VFPPPADERFIFGTKRSAGNSKPLVFAIRTQILALDAAHGKPLSIRFTVALTHGGLAERQPVGPNEKRSIVTPSKV